METIRGRTSCHLDRHEFTNRLAPYNRIALDLGTGDGRYVRTLAGEHPDWFVIGVDTCRENVRRHSRAKLPNMLFVIASAQELPGEFCHLFSQVTINFPWGSLLEGLLAGDPALMNGLAFVTKPGAQVEIRLNGGALQENGISLEVGAEAIQKIMDRYGWSLNHPCKMESGALRTFPTTWAKRLASGRDPRAVYLNGWRAK